MMKDEFVHQDATSLSPQEVYAVRFEENKALRIKIWSVLCQDFFQKFIPPDSVVVEVAAGHCEFINHIQASRKFAVDINPETQIHAGPDVTPVLASATDLSALGHHVADIVFVSNFFEHITKPDIVTCLKGIFQVLKPGGSLLVLQPNIRYCAKDYWMFFDHVTPVDDRALCEAMELLGYTVRQCIPRFLPYTMKQSRFPQGPFWVRWYLRLPFVWRLFGAQSFIRAQRPAGE